MMRSTIHHWVQVCPGCGYCAGDLGEAAPGAAEVVRGEAYQQQRQAADVPELARHFLCASLLHEQAGGLSGAAWSAIHAAWAADDAGDGVAARECRTRAAKLMQRAQDAGEAVAGEEGVAEAILTDLWRRAGRFQEALSACTHGRAKKLSPTLERVFAFQAELIQRGDTGRHTIGEAVGSGG
jgi:hypothetical protein